MAYLIHLLALVSYLFLSAMTAFADKEDGEKTKGCYRSKMRNMSGFAICAAMPNGCFEYKGTKFSVPPKVVHYVSKGSAILSTDDRTPYPMTDFEFNDQVSNGDVVGLNFVQASSKLYFEKWKNLALSLSEFVRIEGKLDLWCTNQYTPKKKWMGFCELFDAKNLVSLQISMVPKNEKTPASELGKIAKMKLDSSSCYYFLKEADIFEDSPK